MRALESTPTVAMANTELLIPAIYAAIDSANEALPPERKLAKDPQQAILGPTAQIDSLGLITLLVAVETQVQAKFGLSLSLTFEVAQPQSGVRTIQDLADYVQRKTCANRAA